MRFLQPFRVLRHHDFRMYILAQVGGQQGLFIQQVGMGWLTYRLTESVFMLGVVAFAANIPTLFFASVGGMLADRFNRGRLLVAVQIAFMVQAIVLAALTFSGAIQPWSIVLMAVVLGMITAIDTPIRQSFMVRMIDDVRDMPSAVALGSMTFNVGRMLGPPIGGVLVAWAGESVCFAVVTLANLWALACFSLIRRTTAVSGAKKAAGGMAAALRFARDVPGLRAILLMAAATSFCVLPYPTVLPYFARDVYGGDARTLGFLLSCGGVGALMAGMLVMSQRLHNLPRFLALMMQAGGIATVVFTLMPSPWTAAPVLAVMGGSMLTLGAASGALIQIMARDEMRGRVTSLFTTATYGVMPLGSLFITGVAEYVSVQVTLVLCGLAATLAGMAFLRAESQVRAALHAPKDA